MDKFRAIQYFMVAAEEGSLAGAARKMDVSVPAIHKLVGALEKFLGVRVFERTAKGVRLTNYGLEYLDCCRPIMAELQAAEAAMSRTSKRPSGVLIVGAHAQLAQHILVPALPHFRALYPDVQIDFRTVHRISDEDAEAAEILMLHGWPNAPDDFVHRKLGMTRSLIMATPDYWATRGIPQRPEDLAQHECLLIRNPAGILIDLWDFRRGADEASVRVAGWLCSNGREVVLDAVLRSQGVGRFNEITTRTLVQTGRLIPVLHEWEVQGGPPINLLYRSTARKRPCARVFIDFTIELLRQHDGAGHSHAGHPSADLPAWHRTGYGRASAAVGRRG